MQNRHTERPVHKFPALIAMDRMYACFAAAKSQSPENHYF